MIKEFRDFILRGNVIDLAVAVVIGAAFSAIIKSLVDDVIMPLIGILLGGLDFTSLSVQVGSATLTYGNFIQAIVNFLLIGLVLFLVVKSINALYKRIEKEEEKIAEPEGPSEEVQLLREIRDLLKKQSP
jgi:large conductance mechanosensitive channel